VLTSSIAAVRDRFLKDRLPPSVSYTEEHWSDLEFQKMQNTYKMSKTLAERAAWDYMKGLDSSQRFELVTLCPSLLVGKALHKDMENASMTMIQNFFLKNVPPVRSKFSWINVTDVATAHLQAVKVPEAAN